GAENAGLVAAGQATAGGRGMLLTDSPVAAYYSGRSPSEISGSQAMPLDSSEAVDWMRSHHVTAVVVENISYYRETLVLSDLVPAGLAVAVRPISLAPGYSEVGILNEQSAAFDDSAAAGQPALVGPTFGSWAPVSGSWARLRSGTLAGEWSASQVPGATLYA